MLNNFKNGIIHGLGILFVLGLFSISYASYISINNVSSGESLTPSLINNLISNQDYIKSHLIGYEQDRVDMTLSRVNNTEYTNDTGKTIIVSVNAYNSGGQTVIVYAYVDGKNVTENNADNDGYQRSYANVTFFVPSGSKYKVRTSDGSSSIGSTAFEEWYEFR